MTPEDLVTVLDGRELRPKQTGVGQWIACCPAHEDRDPSLQISTGTDGRVLLHCFAGCELDAILGGLGITAKDLFPDSGRSANGRTVVATYPYEDERGELLYEVVRFEPKGFAQRRPDGAGGHTWKLNGTRRVPYRLPRVLRAIEAGEPVWIVEGERDVHSLEAEGVVATTNAAGAGKCKREYSEALRGAIVRVVADNDEPGGGTRPRGCPVLGRRRGGG
ncbi:MAG TPA: hypothetical protein VMH88_13105 [Gemmatimonadales bacterium]|nr:hypothetical protein [Gemmatimonadales bacterium]